MLLVLDGKDFVSFVIFFLFYHFWYWTIFRTPWCSIFSNNKICNICCILFKI